MASVHWFLGHSLPRITTKTVFTYSVTPWGHGWYSPHYKESLNRTKKKKKTKQTTTAKDGVRKPKCKQVTPLLKSRQLLVTSAKCSREQKWYWTGRSRLSLGPGSLVQPFQAPSCLSVCLALAPPSAGLTRANLLSASFTETFQASLLGSQLSQQQHPLFSISRPFPQRLPTYSIVCNLLIVCACLFIQSSSTTTTKSGAFVCFSSLSCQ